jgi:hypothetical protein
MSRGDFMKNKVFPYFVRIASCLMSLILIITYTILLDTIDLTNIGGWVVLLWFVLLGLFALFAVLTYKFIIFIKENRK